MEDRDSAMEELSPSFPLEIDQQPFLFTSSTWETLQTLMTLKCLTSRRSVGFIPLPFSLPPLPFDPHQTCLVFVQHSVRKVTRRRTGCFRTTHSRDSRG